MPLIVLRSRGMKKGKGAQMRSLSFYTIDTVTEKIFTAG